MARPLGSKNKLSAANSTIPPDEPNPILEPPDPPLSVTDSRIITLTVPQDCTHTPEGLQAYLQELLDTAPKGVHVKIQIR